MSEVSLHLDSLKQWQDENLEHMRYDYDVKPCDNVIDIGSYHREWGKVFEKKGAIVDYFDALDNRAAASFNGEIEFGGAYYYSSKFTEGAKTTYKCVDIAEFINKPIELMKINIEGMEYDLILYIISTGLIKNIKHLQVQFHLIDGIDCIELYNSIATKLKDTHTLSWRIPFCWESWTKK